MSQATLQAVEQLAMQLTTEEQRLLVERLASRFHLAANDNSPKDLRGIWKGAFPDDFDLDSALKEIRSAWKRKLEE